MCCIFCCKCCKNCWFYTEFYLQMFAAEFFGSFLLMFFGCMGCIQNFYDSLTESYRPNTLCAVSFGLTVLTVVQILGHISGSHINPSVTIASFLLGLTTFRLGVVYICAQLLGAIFGFFLLKILLPDKYAPSDFCMTKVNTEISWFQGLVIEIIITMVLIMACCSIWDARNPRNVDSVSIRIGLIVLVITLIAGPLTGASMNTVRSFAPWLLGGTWEGNQWIYYVGPLVAPFLACGLYIILSTTKVLERSNSQSEIPR